MPFLPKIIPQSQSGSIFPGLSVLTIEIAKLTARLEALFEHKMVIERPRPNIREDKRRHSVRNEWVKDQLTDPWGGSDVYQRECSERFPARSGYEGGSLLPRHFNGQKSQHHTFQPWGKGRKCESAGLHWSVEGRGRPPVSWEEDERIERWRVE